MPKALVIEAKHTPWMAITDKYCDSASVVDSSGAELALVGYILSKSKNPRQASREIEKDEIDAIVRLFAAAPELLAACRLALQDRFGWDDPSVDLDPVTNSLRAVIAKAEGRS